jgi:transcription elongation factor Elf1
MDKWESFCPWCKKQSGNIVVVDFPNPPITQRINLICGECGRNYLMTVDHSGVNSVPIGPSVVWKV